MLHQRSKNSYHDVDGGDRMVHIQYNWYKKEVQSRWFQYNQYINIYNKENSRKNFQQVIMS